MRASPLVLGRIASTPSAPTPKWRSQISLHRRWILRRAAACARGGPTGAQVDDDEVVPGPLGFDERKRHGARPVVYGFAGAGAGSAGFSALAGASPAGAPSAGGGVLALARRRGRLLRGLPLGLGFGGRLGLVLGGRCRFDRFARRGRSRRGGPGRCTAGRLLDALARLLEVDLQLLGPRVVGLLLGRLALRQLLQPTRILLAGEVRQPERRQQEEKRRDRREPGQEVPRARRAEDGLAATAAAERDPHAAALSGLQQHDQDQEQADDDVKDSQKRDHEAEPSFTRRMNDSADSEAPPTRPPSTSSSAMSARMLSGLTLPP